MNKLSRLEKIMQLELFNKEDWQIMLEAEEYFDYLQKPHDAFSGMPVCPFLKAEREKDNLMVEIWRPDERPLNSLFREFFKSDYDSALFICIDVEGISFKDITRTAYQKSIQGFLKNWSKESKKYKALCLSPYEDFTAAGEATRKKAPYFLINVAGRKEISDSHNKLKDTKYFDNFSKEEKKKLKV